VCDTTGLKYYGSTTKKYLSARLGAHVYEYNRYLKGESHYYTSFEVFENKNYKIVLVENYPCNSKDELFQRERHFIENNDCVNKKIPIRTVEEKKELFKDYQQTIAPKLKDIRKRYYEKNKEKILEHNKLYREDNKEAFKKMKDDYRLNNKEKVQTYRKEYYDTYKK
jgi:hypothetical protein